jgi:phosphate transport system protein
MIMDKRHTDREYEAQLAELRKRLLGMANRVERMIEAAMTALTTADADLARKTIAEDHRVNRDEVETDELCLLLLARRQPMASDLRFITIGLKMVTDLERIGDLAVNICERAIELSWDPAPPPPHELASMATAAKGMVREAIEAFVHRDDERARRVVRHDRTVDAYYTQVFRDFLKLVTHDPARVLQATRMQAIAKYLERIGDHATNLAELVVFMVKGKDIRHLGSIDGLEEERRPHGILFLCVRNSAVSQMAEGLALALLPTAVRVWSAGSDPAAQLNSMAVETMKEVGIDISHQVPKRITEVPLGEIDTVITLCNEEVCVTLPGELRSETWTYADPGSASASKPETQEAFRRVRDDLKRRIEDLVKS